MTMYGANPEQLAGLGRSMKGQITAIDQVISTVNSALANTVWVGPAHDAFAQQWSGSFKTALERLKTAFDTAGADCITRSAELARVMGAVAR